MSSYYRTLIQQVAPTPPTSLPLDDYTTNLLVVASFRRLLSSYTGPLIEVRRISDNATDDFMPDTNGIISGSSPNQAGTTDLATFLSSTSGRVRTWYNQIGSTHFRNTNTAQQPIIDLASTPTGEALIYHDGTNNVGLVSIAQIDVVTNDEVTIINTFARDGVPVNVYHTPFCTTSTQSTTGALSSPGRFLNYLINTANHRNDVGTGSNVFLGGGVPADQTLTRQTWVYPTSGQATATQNTSATGNSAGTSHTLFNGFIVLGNFSTIRPSRGWYGDFILWSEALGSSDLSTINSEIDNYYGI